MRTIKTYFSKNASALCLLGGTALLAISSISAAHAQYDQTLPWPKTFVGEPDFDFERGEVVEEYKKKKGGEANKYISTLNDLLSAKGIDPYIPRPRTTDIGRSKYSKDVFEQRFGTAKQNKAFREAYPDVEEGTGLEIRTRSGKIVQAQLINDTQAKTLDETNPIVFDIEVAEDGYVVEAFKTESIADTFDSLFVKKDTNGTNDEIEELEAIEGLPSYTLAVNQLPNIENASEEVVENLTEFARFLENIITQTERSKESDLRDLDFREYLSGLVLQSVARSPEKFAIINNIRFVEGDRIPITVSYKKKSADDIEKVIDTYMPSKTGLPQDIYDKYVSLKEAALKKYENDSEEKTPVTDEKFVESGEETKQEEDTLETVETEKKEPSTQEKDNNVQVINGFVKRIESRKVILSILDKEYPLHIRFAL